MSSHSRVFSIICFSTRKYPHPPYGGQWKIWGEGMVQREEISEEKGWLFEVLFSDCQVIKKLTASLLSKLSVNGHFKIRIAVLIEKILNKLGWMLFSWNRHANKSPVISRLLYYTTVIMLLIISTIWCGTHNRIVSKRINSDLSDNPSSPGETGHTTGV